MTGAEWTLIAGVAAITALIKAAGPVALGGRALPPWFAGVVSLMAPALLAALVVTQTFARGDEWAVGANTVGVAAAGVAFLRGASVITGVALAVAVTAGLRLVA